MSLPEGPDRRTVTPWPAPIPEDPEALIDHVRHAGHWNIPELALSWESELAALAALGITPADADEAEYLVSTGYRIRDPWGYFRTVLFMRAAERLRLMRAMTGRG